jgi:PAS domain-containing protein
MPSSALSVSQPDGLASTPGTQTGAEAGDGLSSLLGAGHFLEAVIEHIPAVVFVKDASDFRFILLNRAGEDFLGVSPSFLSEKRDDLKDVSEAGTALARRVVV